MTTSVLGASKMRRPCASFVNKAAQHPPLPVALVMPLNRKPCDPDHVSALVHAPTHVNDGGRSIHVKHG